MKIATIVGARPQFIKAAVVSRAFEKRRDVSEFIIHTGQHFDENMSDVFFSELSIPKPQFNLEVGGGTHGQNTGRMIEKIESVLISEKPDWVLVYGDTDSTLAGAIAASKLHIPIAHVEAGLRSFNRRMPEEINRVLTDHVSSLLLTPTKTAVSNLAKEGISHSRIREVGDVMYDASIFYGARNEGVRMLDDLKVRPKDYVLVTLHRAENVDQPARLSSILKAFALVDKAFVWPLHPRTKKQLKSFDISIPPNVQAIDPVGYLEMVLLEKNASVIATDSGGVQKEAYFHKTHCITLREETEWTELVSAGANRLVGANTEQIVNALTDEFFLAGDAFKDKLYGDGMAGEKVVGSIVGERL